MLRLGTNLVDKQFELLESPLENYGTREAKEIRNDYDTNDGSPTLDCRVACFQSHYFQLRDVLTDPGHGDVASIPQCKQDETNNRATVAGLC